MQKIWTCDPNSKTTDSVAPMQYLSGNNNRRQRLQNSPLFIRTTGAHGKFKQNTQRDQHQCSIMKIFSIHVRNSATVLWLTSLFSIRGNADLHGYILISLSSKLEANSFVTLIYADNHKIHLDFTCRHLKSYIRATIGAKRSKQINLWQPLHLHQAAFNQN